ncbi:MAG TPA: MEDS domain-containing protein [Elusimicrobiota bacterium]|nr:MEDS domain-containing protein [Elusimicrobiota bacterium]
MNTLEETLPGLTHGDHCCLFFTSPEEQSRITAPFLAIGLERGERCVFVGNDPSIEAVRGGLKSFGVNIEDQEKKNRLILTSNHDYLEDGHWRTEKMLGFLQKAYDGALAEDFTALRAAGDVSWQVGPHKEYQDLVYYEALLDLFFIGKRMVGMCQYPKDTCPAETLAGILNTHKIAAIDSEVCSNFHYLPPQMLIEKDAGVREKKRVEWMTAQLLRVKRAEEERDAIGQQLLQSQKMEAVGRLAGGVAHDFNNILTAILGLSDFVLENPSADSSVKGDVKEIKIAGERAAALTRQLLAFSRRQVLQPRVINLNDTVSSMDRFLGRIIGASIELTTFLSPALGNVKADPGQIEQVIMNLVVNARDAMPNGGKIALETGDVELSEDYAEAHPEVSAGPYVMLAVSDTGEGMDARTQARIFEPFFTTRARGKGTGLGLSTVHGIVKQSGGSIFVYSEPGKGSTFKIYFPRVEENAEAPAKAGPRVESLNGTETIIVVDDDDIVRKLVHRTLAEHGYTVLDAMSSREALTFCERHKGNIHLMLTDAILPHMNGRELGKRVGVLRPKTKIIFMSGYTDDAVVHHGILEAGSAFVEKPFTPEAILRKVREVLDA